MEQEGYIVFTHKGSFGATNAVRDLQPDLILLDINMPALSGDSLSTLLLSNDNIKHIPILFYSSNDEDSLRESVYKFGVSGYICKGNIFELKRKVDYFINRQ